MTSSECKLCPGSSCLRSAASAQVLATSTAAAVVFLFVNMWLVNFGIRPPSAMMRSHVQNRCLRWPAAADRDITCVSCIGYTDGSKAQFLPGVSWCSVCVAHVFTAKTTSNVPECTNSKSSTGTSNYLLQTAVSCQLLIKQKLNMSTTTFVLCTNQLPQYSHNMISYGHKLSCYAVDIISYDILRFDKRRLLLLLLLYNDIKQINMVYSSTSNNRRAATQQEQHMAHAQDTHHTRPVLCCKSSIATRIYYEYSCCIILMGSCIIQQCVSRASAACPLLSGLPKHSSRFPRSTCS